MTSQRLKEKAQGLHGSTSDLLQLYFMAFSSILLWDSWVCEWGGVSQSSALSWGSFHSVGLPGPASIGFLFYFIIFILFLKYFKDYIIIILMEGTALVVMLLEVIQTYQSTWSHGADGLISSNYYSIHEYEGAGSISENKKGSRGYDLRQNKVISDREMSSVTTDEDHVLYVSRSQRNT